MLSTQAQPIPPPLTNQPRPYVVWDLPVFSVPDYYFSSEGLSSNLAMVYYIQIM